MARIKFDQIRDRSLHVKLRKRHWDEALKLAEEKPGVNVCMRCPVALAINDVLKAKFRRHPRVYSSVAEGVTTIYEIEDSDRYGYKAGFRVARLIVPAVGVKWIDRFDTLERSGPFSSPPPDADFVVELEKTITI